MEHESHELVKLHEGFRFFSYVLLFASLYLTELNYFVQKGIQIPAFHPIIEKMQNLKFLAGLYPSKVVCLIFLAITCIGTKAHKDRELQVSTIVGQTIAGLNLYWGSLLVF